MKVGSVFPLGNTRPIKNYILKTKLKEYEIDSPKVEQNGEIFDPKTYGSFEPIVLTPSNPSEPDIDKKNSFIFPSPPKAPNHQAEAANSISSDGSEFLMYSPARSSR